MFDCQAVSTATVKGRPDYKTCTGRNSAIFHAVWSDENMGRIARKAIDKYAEHNRTRGAGGDFVAVFYCHSGHHKSIAAAAGLHTWMQQQPHGDRNRMNISVLCGHGIIRRCSTCSRCLEHPWRPTWESLLVDDEMIDKNLRPFATGMPSSCTVHAVVLMV